MVGRMQDREQPLMLLANIIYFPGTGGSFLRRALTLSDQAIMHDSHQQISAKEKFFLYNNWNAQEWKQAEKMYRPDFKTGNQEFYCFEQSNLYLIDAWHPTEFLDHDNQGTAWQTGAWPWLIFITVEQYHREFLEKNQSTKSYNLDWQKESESFQCLRDRYHDRALYLKFNDLLNESIFLQNIQDIDRKINVHLDLTLVNKLWTKWYKESMKIWRK